MTRFIFFLIAVAAVYALLVVRRIAIRLRTLRRQLAAYGRGDYLGQLQAIEGFRVRGSEPGHYLFFRGSALYHLGRLEEAEQALRRSLAGESYRPLKTCCRDELGHVLMALGRWDEAEGCIQECIRESPERGTSYRSMAELILRRGSGQALDAAQEGVARDRAAKTGPGKLAKEDYETNLSESLAVLAWALARSGADSNKVEAAVQESFAAGATAKPVLGEIHYFAGRAFEELRNGERSRNQFRVAAEVDPLGVYGRLALSALTALVK